MTTHTLLLILSAAAFGLACGAVSDPNDTRSDADVSSSTDAGTGTADAAAPDATPLNAVLTVSPIAHGFGPIAISANSAVETFTFTNTGGAAATGCTAAVRAGANASDFTIVTDNCGTSDLVAGGSCTVGLSVTPSAAGIRTMTLTRTCTEGGSASTTVNGIEVNKPMHAFITSLSYDGNLGGLSGADGICNSLGTGGTVSGPLNKTWKALISKTTGGVVNASERFSWTGPMYDLAGNMVTQDPSSWPWIDAGDNSKIDVNEDGGGPDDSYVWTGSTINGVTKVAGNDCAAWSSNSSGDNGWSGETSNFPSSRWFDSFGNGCGDTWFGIYCISE